MSCPVLCFSCGKILGNKYHYFIERVIAIKQKQNLIDVNKRSILDINADELKITPEGQVLNEMGLIRDCCRKIYLCNINLIDNI